MSILRNEPTQQAVQCACRARDSRRIAADGWRLPALRCSTVPTQLLPAAVMPITTRRVGWRWQEAVELCVSPLPDDQRPEVADELLRDARSGVTSLRPSRVVIENRTLLGCIIVAKQMDSSWLLQLPVVSEEVTDAECRDEIRRALVTDLATDFDLSDSWIAQILLTHEQESDSRFLTENGFPILTELSFMSATVSEHRPRPPEGELWQSDSWSESIRPRFDATITATYQGTLDCPELNGLRSEELALLGHEVSGPFQPDLWQIYSQAETDAGLILARCHSDESEPVFEIVYFGVTPPFRGRGLGQKMLADLFAEAARQGVSEIMLAVDVRNAPAIRLYEQSGFREFDRRQVHARLGATRYGEPGESPPPAAPCRLYISRPTFS